MFSKSIFLKRPAARTFSEECMYSSMERVTFPQNTLLVMVLALTPVLTIKDRQHNTLPWSGSDLCRNP